MDYNALAKQFGAIDQADTPQVPNWAANLSPKDQADLNMKLYEEGRKRLSELNKEISKTAPVMDDLNEFGRLNRQSRTGGIMENILPNWRLLHGEDENQMMAIQSRLGPAQRPEGSGASSDTDVRLFMGGLPSITQTGPVNRQIREDFERKYKYAVEKRNAMQQYLNKFGNLNGFDEAWDAKAKQKPARKSKMTSPKFLGFEE